MAFGIGIWLGGSLHRPAWLWAFAAGMLVVCAVTAAIRDSIRLGYTAVGAALICAGAFSRVWMPAPQIYTPPPDFLYTDEVEIIGHVTNDGALLAGSEPRERFDLETESIQTDEGRFTQPVGIRASVYLKRSDDSEDETSGSVFPPLAYGDRVRFTARLRLPRNFRNPGAFDYEGYLHGLGITTLASVRADKLEFLPGKAGNWLGFWRSKIRTSILQHVHNPKLWNEDDAALFAAMVVGDDSLLLRHVREEFQETGVYHLLWFPA